MRIIVLGSSGLIGNTITKFFLNQSKYETFGILRDLEKISFFDNRYHKNFIHIDNILDFEKFEKILIKLKPKLIINCLGITNKFLKNNFKSV